MPDPAAYELIGEATNAWTSAKTGSSAPNPVAEIGVVVQPDEKTEYNAKAATEPASPAC